MKRLVLWALLLMGSATDVLACSCYTIGESSAPMPAGGIVFRGKVVATEIVAVGQDGDVFIKTKDSRGVTLYRVAVFEVSEKFRGDIPPFVIIATGSGGGDCGYPFETGKSYMIDGEWTLDETLANLGGGARAATTSICSLTAPEDRATEILERLRKRYPSKSPLFVK
jgi:hypothetical protein